MDRKTHIKLTELIVRGLPAGAEDRFTWDTGLPGFGVRVKPPSARNPQGARAYVLWYRTRGATKRLFTIGSTATFRLEQARNDAREWQVRIRKGADPLQERHDARKAKTISELCSRYLEEHVKVHNKTSTAGEVKRIVENRIEPALGRILITELSRSRVKQWHQDMADIPYEANRCLSYLSKMLSLAANDWELRPENPCRGIKKFPEKKRERFLSGDELKRLGEALALSENAQLEKSGAVACIRLLALTGCRLSEILGLTWERVDLAKSALWLADVKSGSRAVPLGAPATALLKAISCDRKGWVIRGDDAEAPLSIWVLETAWRRIRKRAKLQNARLHDLRHTVGTYAGQAGLNAFMVRDLLGHKTLAMTGRYVERDTDPLRAAADHVSSRIAAAMSGASAKVIRFRG